MKIILDITINNNITGRKIIEMSFCPTIGMRLSGKYIHAKVRFVTYLIESKELYANLELIDTTKSRYETNIDIKRNMEQDGWTVSII